MPNYEDFKKYGEMEKQKRTDQAAPESEPVKPESGAKKLLGKLKGTPKS